MPDRPGQLGGPLATIRVYSIAPDPPSAPDPHDPVTDTAPAPIIVALDRIPLDRAITLVDELHPQVWGFKLNDLLFDPEAPRLLRRRDTRFFLDVKLHDIPNTVGNAVTRLVEAYRPALITVHASGGRPMLQAASEAAQEAGTRVGRVPGILAVTVLTSIDAPQCRTIYGHELPTRVRRFAEDAQAARCSGIVCSRHELAQLGDLALDKVVPGIRPQWWLTAHKSRGIDDHARAATPRAALDAGASLLVIGRPITEADDPARAASDTIGEL